MNITTHVPPEELMAFLDVELSATEAQAVSRHIDECTECAKVVEQLRRSSQELSAWMSAPVPAKVELSITEFVAKAKSGADLGKPDFVTRASFWTGRQYAAVSLGAISALLILGFALTPNLLRGPSMTVASHSAAIHSVREQVVQGGGGGDRTLGKPTYGGSASNGPSKTQGIVGGVAGGVPGRAVGGVVGRIGSGSGIGSESIATDSNGLLHGLGDHAQGSFSVDGQPAVDQQSRVFSNDESAPMIARTVSLSIVVKDFAASRFSLDTILARYEGYSAQLNANTTENAPRILQASLRIPGPYLSPAISDLKKLGRVENESQSGEEVTRQHADLVARLKNSRDTEQRLREILQQRTGKVGEVLQVEREVARVRGEIEGMEAEQKSLEHRVDFATVELQLTEEYKAELNPPAPSVATRIHNAFVAGYHNATETALGILLFFAESGPVLLIWLTILAAPVLLIWRRYRRIRALHA